MRQIKPATAYLRFNSDKKLFVLMLVVIVSITIDLQIGNIADFVPEQISSNGGILTFIIIAVMFVVIQYLILNNVKHFNKETRQRVPHLVILHTCVSVAQYLLAAVVLIIILQILLANQYNIITLYIIHVISYGLWLVILALLEKAFYSW